MRIISILIRYCPHRYSQSYSCWLTASWCSLSPAQEKWWPQHCGQSSQCSCPQPGSTGSSLRPGEWWEPGSEHCLRRTPPRSSSARTWCWCLFPEGQETLNIRSRRSLRPTSAIRLFLRSNFRQVIFGRNSSSSREILEWEYQRWVLSTYILDTGNIIPQNININSSYWKSLFIN